MMKEIRRQFLSPQSPLSQSKRAAKSSQRFSHNVTCEMPQDISCGLFMPSASFLQAFPAAHGELWSSRGGQSLNLPSSPSGWVPGLKTEISAEFAARWDHPSWFVSSGQSSTLLHQRAGGLASHLHAAPGSFGLTASSSCSPTQGSTSARAVTAAQSQWPEATGRLRSRGRRRPGGLWVLHPRKPVVLRVRPADPEGGLVSGIPAVAPQRSGRLNAARLAQRCSTPAPGQHDAPTVPEGEAQPAAESKPLLARVLLVSAPPGLW